MPPNRAMVDSYEEYEQAYRVLREENAVLLEDFADWIRKKGLSENTVKRHFENIEFYVNEFLLYEEAKPPSSGVQEAGCFLGYWFIRKALWASQTSIRSYSASLKKFYQFMFERGLIEREALDDLKAQIKEKLPEWLDTLRRYDDPSIEDPWEIWDL